MKKTLRTAAFLLAFAANTFYCLGQDSDGEQPKIPKWEVGTDLLFLFDKQQLPDFSLFASRKLGENGYALRTRLGFDMSSSSPGEKRYPCCGDVQNYNYFILAGLENVLSKIPLGDKTKLYWAVDVALFQEKENMQFTGFSELGDFLFTSQRDNTSRYYLNGSLGINQTIGKRFTIRLESAISYHHKKYELRADLVPLDPSMPIPPKQELMDKITGNFGGGSHNRENFLKLIPINQLLLTIKL